MTILVTGAAGFIGFHVAKKLLGRGESVIGYDNINDYYSVDLKRARLSQLNTSDAFTFHKCDLEDSEAISSVVGQHRVTSIIHLAAQAGVRYSIEAPGKYVQSNVAGFVNVMEAARQHNVSQVIYASSSSVYGDHGEAPFKVSARVDKPVSVYAATKLADELLAHVYSHQYGLNTTGLRFFTVYGPWGRPDMSPFLFTNAIFNGRPVQIFNEGRHKRDFTYIDDIVDGVISVLDGKVSTPYRLYNIGRGEPIDLLDFVELLEELIGKKATKELLPMQPGDLEASWADVSELKRDFGYQPTTDLRTGLEKFVNWYRDYYTL